MPSLRCLVSALTQAGGGDLLFRFASSVQSCCGEDGAMQADIAVCGEHSPCSSTLGLPRIGVSVLSLSTLLRLPAALYGAGPALSGFQFSGPPQKRGFGCACVLCLPRPQRFRQPEACAPSPPVRRAFSLRSPSARRWRVGSQEVFRQEPGPVCRVWGGWLLWG